MKKNTKEKLKKVVVGFVVAIMVLLLVLMYAPGLFL